MNMKERKEGRRKERRERETYKIINIHTVTLRFPQCKVHIQWISLNQTPVDWTSRLLLPCHYLFTRL